LQLPYAGNGHPGEIYGLVGGRVRFVHVHPAAMFPNVGHFQEIRIESRVLEHSAKGWFVEARGARSNDNSVESMGCDIFFDPLLSRFRAGIGDIPGNHHVIKARGGVCDFLAIHGARNIQSTLADVNANAGGGKLLSIHSLP